MVRLHTYQPAVAFVPTSPASRRALCSKEENSDFLRRGPQQPGTAVEIGNPATLEFEVCRTTLLPAALKTLGANKDSALPIKLFEVSDVVLIDPEKDVGARNERHLVAVYCNKCAEQTVTTLLPVLG